MGYKSQPGGWMTGFKECGPRCICIFCKRKRKENYVGNKNEEKQKEKVVLDNSIPEQREDNST